MIVKFIYIILGETIFSLFIVKFIPFLIINLLHNKKILRYYFFITSFFFSVFYVPIIPKSLSWLSKLLCWPFLLKIVLVSQTRNIKVFLFFSQFFIYTFNYIIVVMYLTQYSLFWFRIYNKISKNLLFSYSPRLSNLDFLMFNLFLFSIMIFQILKASNIYNLCFKR